MDGFVISGAFAIVLIILFILIFSRQLSYWLNATKKTIASMVTGAPPREVGLIMDDEYGSEHLTNNNPQTPAMNSDDVVNNTLMEQGYGDGAPWDETLKATELDPSIFANHADFVKDTRTYSSGANFTSVADDNGSTVFTNFIGLRRPQPVPIGDSVREEPDVDETVLGRNKPFIFN
jgi:hypothetical protein